VEQRTFARLAVFPDHFTLEMAEAVVSEPPVGEVTAVVDRYRGVSSA
jgi:hypothetical protein